MAEQAVSVKLSIDASGAVRVLSDTGQALSNLGSKAESAGRKAEASFGGVGSSLRHIAEIATGISLAGLFTSAAAAMRGLVTEGVNYNASLESSRLTIASLLQGTTTITDSTGAVVSATKAWQVNLSAAAKLQEQIAQLSATTLGTQQELLDIFRGVLAFGKGQQATDEERLKVAQGILNVGKLQGLEAQLLSNETRQIFTLQSAVGQVILPILGISIEQARQYKLQGTYIQELNKALAVYNLLAEDSALTWVGLTTTVSTFKNLLLAESFAGAFAGLKQILLGVRDELTRIRATGGLSTALNISDADLQALGTGLAQFFAQVTGGAAKATN